MKKNIINHKTIKQTPKYKIQKTNPTTKRDTRKEVTFLLDDNPTPVEGKQSKLFSPYVHPILSTTGRGDFGGKEGFWRKRRT